MKPGSVPTVKPSTMPFKQMEAINAFLTAAEQYGVIKTNLFQTVDLFEKQNMNAVVNCLLALKMVNEGKGTLKSNAAKPLASDPSAVPMHTHGFEKGATQKGQNFGLGRQIIS